jgi:hypothetical protein
MQSKTVGYVIATLGSLIFAGVSQAGATGSQRIEPAVIRLGEAARLTISESGDSPVTPPMVAGLEFVATSQSKQMESINGISSTTTSVTYDVVPQQVGVFTIPSALPGAQPLVLTVNPGSAVNPSSGRVAVQGGIAPGSSAQPAMSALPAGATRLNADGSAFVRLRLAKHQLYVGESVPVDIQVGMRDGFVASLNGLPTLNGDAFTLNKLSTQPVRTEEIINGKPFTVLSWHSALAAVKPGTLSLAIETPLTVRMRTTARADASLLGDAGLGDLINDPMFQNFFGTTTEKEVTVASAPMTFSVLELPVQNRPGDFSGAVGHFSVSGGISEDHATLGDPITLRMRVSGEGSFDRVSSPMLHGTQDWKTYAPTAAFKADDDIGYHGEKTFEQPLIATRAGTDSVPGVGFSWFDPTTKRYVEAHTAPLSVLVAPGTAAGTTAAGGTAAGQSTPSAPPQQAGATAGDSAPSDGLRADQVETGGGSTTLRPHFFQPPYMAAPSALLAALSGSLLWIRRRDRRRAAGTAGNASFDLEECVKLMEEASASHDVQLFFKSARAALQIVLGTRWHCSPSAIDQETIDARLGSKSGVSQVFEMADESAYSGIRHSAINFAQWKTMIQRHISGEALN